MNSRKWNVVVMDEDGFAMISVVNCPDKDSAVEMASWHVQHGREAYVISSDQAAMVNEVVLTLRQIDAVLLNRDPAACNACNRARGMVKTLLGKFEDMGREV